MSLARKKLHRCSTGYGLTRLLRWLHNRTGGRVCRNFLRERGTTTECKEKPRYGCIGPNQFLHPNVRVEARAAYCASLSNALLRVFFLPGFQSMTAAAKHISITTWGHTTKSRGSEDASQPRMSPPTKKETVYMSSAMAMARHLLVCSIHRIRRANSNAATSAGARFSRNNNSLMWPRALSRAPCMVRAGAE